MLMAAFAPGANPLAKPAPATAEAKAKAEAEAKATAKAAPEGEAPHDDAPATDDPAGGGGGGGEGEGEGEGSVDDSGSVETVAGGSVNTIVDGDSLNGSFNGGLDAGFDTATSAKDLARHGQVVDPTKLAEQGSGAKGVKFDVPGTICTICTHAQAARPLPAYPLGTLSYPLLPSPTLSYPLLPSPTLSYPPRQNGQAKTQGRAEGPAVDLARSQRQRDRSCMPGRYQEATVERAGPARSHRHP